MKFRRNPASSLDDCTHNFEQLESESQARPTGTVPLAKITAGGHGGSITINEGVVVSIVQPT